jgi:hypothetical protein
MKSILTLLLVLGFTSQALANDRLARRVQNISERVNHRIQMDAYHLSDYQLEMIAERYREINDILRGRDPGHPGNPGYGERMEAKSIILAGMRAVQSDSSKSNIAYQGIRLLEDPTLNNLSRSCMQTTTYADRARCFDSGLSGIRGQIRLEVDGAKTLISRTCMQTTTFRDRASCFDASVEASRSNQLHNDTIGCRAISSDSSKSNCYYQALRN